MVIVLIQLSTCAQVSYNINNCTPKRMPSSSTGGQTGKLQKAAAVSMQKENMMILKRNSHLQPHAKQNKLPQLASNIW